MLIALYGVFIAMSALMGSTLNSMPLWAIRINPNISPEHSVIFMNNWKEIGLMYVISYNSTVYTHYNEFFTK